MTKVNNNRKEIHTSDDLILSSLSFDYLGSQAIDITVRKSINFGSVSQQYHVRLKVNTGSEGYYFAE